MPQFESGLTIDELADAVGVPVRTVRYYIAEGLMPGPEGRGKLAFYGEEHRNRLRLIRLLADQRLPLTEIRERLTGLSPDDIRALLAEETSQSAELGRAEQSPSPREYISKLLRKARPPPEGASESSVLHHLPTPSWHGTLPQSSRSESPAPKSASWQRWELAPGVELHVRADAQKIFRHLIERLLREAGK